ncbi:hypothetical protein ACSBM8_12875 [Sphingomonas sp. ASY06-1R]|uniref:hypothetical protein n=1 Tax=Sphingomonas sp. ASY06-1R TaxID=3445771 RepID=UPI003FA1B9F9
MNEAAFSNWIRDNHIRSDAYVIGAPLSERYVAARGVLGWSVYYSERGLRRNVQRFWTKSAALEELVRRINGDPFTRSD